MEKVNKSKTVRDYIQANPNATAAETAFQCNVNVQYVHQVKHNLKKSLDKNIRVYRKTTLEKKSEPKIVKVKRTPTKEEPLLSNRDVSDMIVQAVEMECKIESLKEKIKTFEHDIIGYKAVIDFLEWQLNLRMNNHGATV
jgi:folate-dependent phosphoribosylglycinamide formyltransferase PurN